MAWKIATLTWESGTGGPIFTRTVEVAAAEESPLAIEIRGGFLRTRQDGVISHINVARIIAIDELPEPDPAEAVRAADGE